MLLQRVGPSPQQRYRPDTSPALIWLDEDGDGDGDGGGDGGVDGYGGGDGMMRAKMRKTHTTFNKNNRRKILCT